MSDTPGRPDPPGPPEARAHLRFRSSICINLQKKAQRRTMRPRDVTPSRPRPRRFQNPSDPQPCGRRGPAALTFLLGIVAARGGRCVRRRICHGAALPSRHQTNCCDPSRGRWENRMEPDWGPPPLPRTSPPAGPPPAPIGCLGPPRPPAPQPVPRIGAASCHSAAAPRPPDPPPRGRDPGRGAGRSRSTPLGSLFEADSKSAVCALISGDVSRARRLPVPQCPGHQAPARGVRSETPWLWECLGRICY